VDQREREGVRLRVAVEQDDRQQPPDLALGDERLVELERVVDAEAVGGEGRRERDGNRDPQDRVRGDGEMAAAAAGEVPPRGADVAGLLRQPAEAVRDVALVLERRAAIAPLRSPSRTRAAATCRQA
jgi:hypothetical protein